MPRRLLLRTVARVLATVLVAVTASPRTAVAAAPPPVRGIVVDTAGQPLANVQVVATELQRVVVTDDAGRFTIGAAPVGTLHLTIVYVGYAPVHEVVTVPASGEPITLRIVMRRTALRLPGVQITASPTGTDPLSVTQSTVQLSGKDLARQLGTSVAQTLAAEPGMAMRFNGPMANVPVIRGLTGERILTLQDGERVGDLGSTSGDHAFVADPNSAERIEVIRGPASLLYGNAAIGGVVNVISADIPTSIPARLGGFVNTQAESVNPGAVGSAALNVPLGRSVAATLRGTVRRQQSYRIGDGGGAQPNSDVRSWNGTAGLGFVGEKVTAGVVYRQSSFNYGIPFESGGEEIRIDGVRKAMQARVGITTGSRALSYVRLEGTLQSYTHDEIEVDANVVGTTFNLKSQTASVTGKTQLGRVNGSVGVQAFLRQYQPIGDEAFTPGADNTNVAAFIYQELPLTSGQPETRTPRLQFGGRYDTYAITAKAGSDPRFLVERDRRFDNASGSLGISLPFAGHFTLSGSVARAFRAPTVDELYANGFHVAVGTFDIGDATLKAETSTGLDAVLRAQSGSSFMQFSTYRNHISDYIAPVIVGDTDVDGETVPLVNIRQRDATLTGLEFSGETQLAHHLVIGAMADAMRGRAVNGTNLPFMPAARVGGSLRYDTGAWSAGGEARRVFRQSRVAADNSADVPTDSYTLVNLSGSWTLPSRRTLQTLTLRVDNLLDARFADATSRIKAFTFNPGRNVSLVYRLGF